MSAPMPRAREIIGYRVNRGTVADPDWVMYHPSDVEVAYVTRPDGVPPPPPLQDDPSIGEWFGRDPNGEPEREHPASMPCMVCGGPMPHRHTTASHTVTNHAFVLNTPTPEVYPCAVAGCGKPSTVVLAVEWMNGAVPGVSFHGSCDEHKHVDSRTVRP